MNINQKKLNKIFFDNGGQMDVEDLISKLREMDGRTLADLSEEERRKCVFAQADFIGEQDPFMRPSRVVVLDIRENCYTAITVGSDGRCFTSALSDLVPLLDEPRMVFPPVSYGPVDIDPASVPDCEAWLVECEGERCNAVKQDDAWLVPNHGDYVFDEDVTLIARLVPLTKPEPGHPMVLETEQDAWDAPVGTIVALPLVGPSIKCPSGRWRDTGGNRKNKFDRPMQVLRWGWGR